VCGSVRHIHDSCCRTSNWPMVTIIVHIILVVRTGCSWYDSSDFLQVDNNLKTRNYYCRNDSEAFQNILSSGVIQQGRQSTCKVISKQLCVTVVLLWENNKYFLFWVFVCSIRRLACERHAKCYFVICDLSGSNIIFHIISYWGWGVSCWAQNALVNFLYNFCLKCFSLWKELKRDIAITVHKSLCKMPLFLSDFNENLITTTDFFFKKILTYQI